MADPTTYHRFVLHFMSPWRGGADVYHQWSSKFSVSGTIEMDEADAEATALSLAEPMIKLCSARSYVEGWSYYPSGTNVALHFAAYQPGDHPCDGSGYTAGQGQGQQLEVAILATAHVGTNAKGKPTYLRKFIHDVCSGGGGPNTIGPIPNPGAILAPWNTGAGPHAVVPVSPSTGKQGDQWVFEPYLYSHQMRRGKAKPKSKSSSDGSVISQLLQDLAALKTLVENVPAP